MHLGRKRIHYTGSIYFKELAAVMNKYGLKKTRSIGHHVTCGKSTPPILILPTRTPAVSMETTLHLELSVEKEFDYFPNISLY